MAVYNRQQTQQSEEPNAGAAAILQISDTDIHSTIFELEIHTTVQIEHATSSYETEIVALHAGLTSLKEMTPEGRQIHICTDSLSCLQQLQSMPYKYKYTNAVVNEVAENLTNLTDNNEIKLHFIPSHTDKIPQSDKIDALAKKAAESGDPIEHSPMISSYKLAYAKYEKVQLQNHLDRTVYQQ